ncbi:MAG: hypothetical protein GWO22_11400, partial [Actinobacteria bacterium]|nr:hypothetical protein [Actinomycetota bacterium]
GWWLTGCSVINTDTGTETREAGQGGWVPQLRAGEADIRFQGLDPQWHHPILEDQLWPAAWTGLMSAGSIETEQAEILHPDFLGIVAPYRGAPGRA